MKKWRKIDNTAKIFSLDFKKNANIFRFSIILKDKVSKKILEQALNKSLESHEAFKVKLKMGWFWDYFEYNDKKPIINERNNDLKHFDYVGNNNYLFKVTYNKKVINVDFFHLLTDGLGAISFIKSIISNYLDIKNGTSYNYLEKKYEVRYEDELIKNYDKSSKSSLSLKSVKLTDFADSLTSMVLTQVVLLSTFGGGIDVRMFNGFAGMGVSLIIMIMSLTMIINIRKYLEDSE